MRATPNICKDIHEFDAAWDQLDLEAEDGIGCKEVLWRIVYADERLIVLPDYVWDIVRTPKYARIVPYLMRAFVIEYHFSLHGSSHRQVYWDIQIRRLLSLGARMGIDVVDDNGLQVEDSIVEETENYRAIATLSAFTICMLAPRGGVRRVQPDLIRSILKPMLVGTIEEIDE